MSSMAIPHYDWTVTNCDCIWENAPCSEFYEMLVGYIFDKLFPRANPPVFDTDHTLGFGARASCL